MKQAAEILKRVGLLDLLQDQQPANEVELAFLARQLVQVTLPHSDPGDVPVWTRRNGDLMLIMTRADIDAEGKLIGYPFGSLPRLLLYWINSEAVLLVWEKTPLFCVYCSDRLVEDVKESNG